MNERQQRECPLRPEWIRWWRESLRVIQDQGSLVLADGAIYRIDHARKRVVLVHGTPSRGIVDRRCIEACGYGYEVFPDPTAAAIVAIEGRDPRTAIICQIGPDRLLIRRPIELPEQPEES